LAEVTLVGCLLWSVLAFGGTEPALLSVAQIVLFATIAFFVLTWPDSLIPENRPAQIIPAVLIAIVLVQLCPVPSSWLGRSGQMPAAELAGARWTHWTIQS
jgi:uncharacterized membrane protein YtjA (UPF0391 family)